MFRWIWLISSIVAGVKGLAILESELVKRIFQQDPSFCFQPSHLIGCNGTDSNVSLDQKKEGAFEENPSTLAFLFTRRNPSRPEFLHLCNYSLPNNTYFGTKFQTEIFIHGFLDGVCRSAWMRVSPL
ncbi:inactive pancreatic lipase-related protein 1 [Trichonephila clavata]|uniref:Inactive pancreatic lipase-related protein 1 n=1 Tax=Trichonephila clavata TaxID=2740835 RepID=A0A8X6KJ81_TRICU|nr:inactive pancreatic lipase-related protein 1 [Trichonephila clavata]